MLFMQLESPDTRVPLRRRTLKGANTAPYTKTRAASENATYYTKTVQAKTVQARAASENGKQERCENVPKFSWASSVRTTRPG